ncbi:MAG: response regulator transcription factor [Rhodospirillaceae bacterium]|nr:response regulator transcription factor [Rhodospirillaceae bacterium]
MLRILFADDHALLREGLRPFLEQIAEDTDVREADALDAALACFKGSEPPQLILLDLNMPGMDGIQGIARARKTYPDAKVVVISGYFDKRIITTVLKAGVDGFIPKTSSGRTLRNALRLVLDGERYLPTNLLESGSSTLALAALIADGTNDGPWDKLTPREGDILRLLVDGKTNKEIARVLGLNEVTVKGHLRNAYRKIGANNRADAVRIALQVRR